MDNNGYQQPMAPVQPITPEQVEAENALEKNKKINSIKNILIAVLAVTTLLFAVLFIVEFMKFNKLNNDIDDTATARAAELADARLTALEQEFDERDKNPYSLFVGPEDYGRLEFEYPRTYSVYVTADASDGKNYQAYFNPNQVPVINNKNNYALQVDILNESFDSVVSRYDATLSYRTITINGQTANYYTGTLPGTELNGYMVIFKIRDKTVILRSYDSIYKQDFDNIIDSITFNS